MSQAPDLFLEQALRALESGGRRRSGGTAEPLQVIQVEEPNARHGPRFRLDVPRHREVDGHERPTLPTRESGGELRGGEDRPRRTGRHEEQVGRRYELRQLVQDVWSDGWVWYLGPAIGAVLAAFAYEFLYLRPTEPAPVGPPETGVEEPGVGRAAAG